MNHRNHEGRRDHQSGQGQEQGRWQREPRNVRSTQASHEDPSGRSRMQGQSYGRGRGEYYGSSQFDDRMQSAGWDDDRSSWEYEGGPERFGGSGYSEAGDTRWQQQGLGRNYGQARSRDYGHSGSGDYSRGRQSFGAQGSYGSEYDTYGRGQGYGEGSGYTRGQRGSSDFGTSSVYGGESSEYGGRGSLYGSQDYLDEGEMSGYGRRDLGTQQHASSSSGRYGTAPGQYGYGGYGMKARSYRGVGPRNYTRSDERLTEEINERLTDDDDLDASEISVRVSSGKVTLEGSVDQRWMKHRAEDIADACSGVKEVENRIQVTPSGSALGQQDREPGRSATGRTGAAGTTGTTGTGGSTGSGGATPH